MPADEHQTLTRALLMAGMLACAAFYAIVLLQIAIDASFSIREHPISLLALGPNGWMQATNFTLTGLLFAAGAFGIFRDGRFRAASFLIVLAAIGLLAVAIFPADPFKGYPPGSSAVDPTEISDHAKLHGLGFMLIFGGIFLAAIAVIIAAWRSESTALKVVTLLALLAIPLCLAIGFSSEELNSEAFVVVGLFGFGWVSYLCWWLQHTRSE